MGDATEPSEKVFEYHALRGFFIQSEPKTNSSGFDYTKTNFGLIERSYESENDSASELTQWERLEYHLNALNSADTANTVYKLLYLGRHGEGHHNVAESFYGTAAWDSYWSHLDGNGTVTWSDALLTDKGEEQAREAHAFFGEQLAWAKMPSPEAFYLSPLMRCLRTAELTWTGLDLPKARPYDPLVKELLREVLGVHTCDRRSSRTVIHKAYPKWRIEGGFSEADVLWKADHRETHDEHDIRTQRLLDDIFGNDERSVLSLTAHSGMIASLLRVTGHREFGLPTGGLLPLFVKATRTG